tara:strand:+ start:56497 stop:57450 length:954 start_codon:yes stop_codon:yes gene_type:complete
LRRFKGIVYLFLVFCGCLSLEEPELDWEDVEAEHDPQLNIMAILSPDTLVETFVRVQRTLRVEEPTDTLVRNTVEGNIYPYYASRFIVRDARVVLSNNSSEYELEFFGYNPETYQSKPMDVYQYKGDDLLPKPGETWTLSVSTPSGLTAKGETVVPPAPEIHKAQLPDSFNIHRTMNIVWSKQEENHQILNVNNRLSYYLYEENDSLRFNDVYWSTSCGFWEEHLIYPGETDWRYRREICEGSFGPSGDDEIEDILMIHLMSMDSNYYNYFIKFATDSEFNSLFFGQGGSGRSFGIEIGIGVFASIGVDRHWMPIQR